MPEKQDESAPEPETAVEEELEDDQLDDVSAGFNLNMIRRRTSRLRTGGGDGGGRRERDDGGGRRRSTFATFIQK